MSYEDQLGALSNKIDRAKEAAEGALTAALESIHRRIDTTRDLAVTDLTELKTAIATDIAAFNQRVQEIEDGIVRHRDQLMQALRAEALDKLRELEDRIKALEGKV